MNEETMLTLSDNFFAAWNSQEIERVLGCYTEDVIYTDPNTRGAVRGRGAMGHYLTKLFAGWKMTWSLREAHLFESRQGCVVLWHATFQPAAGGAMVEADGMDLVMVREDQIHRNDVYFDRTLLSSP